MTRSQLSIRTRLAMIAGVVGYLAAVAAAQPVPQPGTALPPPVALGPDDVAPLQFDPSTCDQESPAAPRAEMVTPITWSDFELAGSFVDPLAVVRALFAPTMSRHRALTEDARNEIKRSATAFGYHVVGIGTRETTTGTHAVIHLAPLPLVRRVDVDMNLSIFEPILDDEVRRRMRIRTGAYVPWSPKERACVLHRETTEIEEFLRDEGYFEARVSIGQKLAGNGVTVSVKVTLGPEYRTVPDSIQIVGEDELAVDAAKIRAVFQHRTCLFGVCFGTLRFSRSRHQADVQDVVELFHNAGFPAVRVRSDFEPALSIDRRTKTVNVTITVDQRRRLDVVFEGHNPSAISNDTLRKQLTFNAAASTDDVEANESANAIAAYLQSRGYFDARVTWSRERFGVFDRIVYRIDQGRGRVIRSVEIAGNRALSNDELGGSIGTKPARLSTSLFGSNTAATSALLAADVDRLVEVYRRAGFRDARVRVSASTDRAALDSAALTAAMVFADRGEGLHVRFTVDEGQPTLLTQVHVELGENGDLLATPDDRVLCRQVLRDLAELYDESSLGRPLTNDRCIAMASNLRFREAVAAETEDLLKDRLYSHGRPRAQVDYEASVLGPRRVAAKYRLSNLQELKIGSVVIRGNFRTRDSIIRGALRLDRGAPLTKNSFAEGARRLRNTALFDAVNIQMPDLDTTGSGEVNAVVEVTERYDFFAQLELETGYSSYNGTFLKLIPSLKNLFGVGISLDTAGTVGFDAGELVNDGALTLRQLSLESTLRIPEWLSPDFFPFLTELTAFHRRQETPRFGLLRTTGATLALSHTWDRPRAGTRQARAITGGVHYDFRSRERNVDALRPIGADDDESQVPITTRTGSVGLTGEWEQRVDRSGALSPLAPQAGFRLDGQISYAHPYLFGQDTFIKVSAAGSKYWSLWNNLVLRADLRFDQGIPLGGAALLPEVERFFAGGDATVRGYDDDRLATEIIQVGVPPLDNVEQIRILPAGGNIRLLGSLDAQLQIYKMLATAVFVDAGMIANQWGTVTLDDVRPSVGMALVRFVTPFGAFAFERALPLRPALGDDPRGRWHISFAARAQF